MRLQLRYANHSNYKNDTMIRKEANVAPAVLKELKRIIVDSEVGAGPATLIQDITGSRRGVFGTHLASNLQLWQLHNSLPPCTCNADSEQAQLQLLREDDANWPQPDRVGRQELEVILDDQHISFTTTKLGSLTQVTQSKDPEGLRVFYYLVQVSLSAPRVHARITHAAWNTRGQLRRRVTQGL